MPAVYIGRPVIRTAVFPNTLLKQGHTVPIAARNDPRLADLISELGTLGYFLLLYDVKIKDSS